MTNTESPNDRAITLAREAHATGRHDHAAACRMALAAVPACKWSPDQLKARAFNPTCRGMFWSFGLALVAWLFSQSVVGNTRTCSYRDYTGRVYTVVQPAAETCDASIQVPAC